MDDGGFERRDTVERWHANFKHISKIVRILPGDQIALGSEGHDRFQRQRRHGANIFPRYMAKAAGIGQPDRFEREARIVDGQAI